MILCLLLAALVLLLYSPISHNAFVNFDDDRYVVQNTHVRDGLHWATVSWAFTSLQQANWHPLTWLSHALDCSLFHLNPAGHHYTSLLLHLLNVLLLFVVLERLTGKTVRSLMVSALFALHPINVESVAWIAERKTVLCMFFFLLAVAAYAWYVRKPQFQRYLAVVVLFAFALMSKPMAITLPFVLLLLDYWPLGRMAVPGALEGASSETAPPSVATRSTPWLIFEKLPLLALSVGSAIMTMMAQKAAGAVVSGPAYPLWFRLENAVVCYARYLEKAVWPYRLAALYPYPHTLPAVEPAICAAIVLLVTGAVLKYRSQRYLLVGWFWFLGTMVPMSGIVQVGNQAMADRYAYLPFIGFFVMVVWGVAEWVGDSRKLLAIASAVALLAFFVDTRVQLKYWHDDLALWTHTLAVTENNYVAETNLGTALMRQGRRDEGVAHFRAAEAIEPGDSVSQLNLGIYAQEHGDLKQAAARYRVALQMTSDSQIRGSAYANLGSIYFANRDYSQAQQNLEAAVKLDQTLPGVLLDLGLIAQKTGDWDHAINYYAQFVQLVPSDVAYLLLSQALERSGRGETARLAYYKAQHISPDINQAQQTVSKLLQQ